jgi:hypothetical protein
MRNAVSKSRAWRGGIPEDDGLVLLVVPAEKPRFQLVEHRQLGRGIEQRVVGNVVGGPDEIIERKNQRPVARMDNPRRDRKILVTIGLAGSQFARRGHPELATLD